VARARDGAFGGVRNHDLRAEATELLRRLVACDTSNPPGREVQAAAVVEDYLSRHGVGCRGIAKDPERPNLIATLPGSGHGPSLAFLGHLDVVPARREHWSVEPFGGIVRDGAVWGRGTIDMKCQVAATAVALAVLAREGYTPGGDLMLILTSDEEVGDAGVGAPHLVAAVPDLEVDYLVGEGAGERFSTSEGPVYLLDHGAKGTVTASVVVRGEAADASLPGTGQNALARAGVLLERVERHRGTIRLAPELQPLLRELSVPAGADDVHVEDAALDVVVQGLVRTVVRATGVEAPGPRNAVPDRAVLHLQCIVLPGTTRAEAEAEIRRALGPGDYELEVEEPLGGSTSPLETPLHHAIRDFLGEHDPEARLIPALGYGFSDCHFMREAYGAVAYGFIPFRHADPMVNLRTKHGADERVLVDDLEFQVLAALSVGRAIGALPADDHGMRDAVAEPLAARRRERERRADEIEEQPVHRAEKVASDRGT
jgi:acetylornithine deacetylase/succinyl-diaminopimelate desuccinylase-like protein